MYALARETLVSYNESKVLFQRVQCLIVAIPSVMIGRQQRPEDVRGHDV